MSAQEIAAKQNSCTTRIICTDFGELVINLDGEVLCTFNVEDVWDLLKKRLISDNLRKYAATTHRTGLTRRSNEAKVAEHFTNTASDDALYDTK